VQIVDDRFDTKDVIREHAMYTNVDLRIVMGIDFMMDDDMLKKMYVRVVSSAQRKEEEWGSLIIRLSDVIFGDKLATVPWFTVARQW